MRPDEAVDQLVWWFINLKLVEPVVQAGQYGGILGFEVVQDVAESVGAGGVGRAHEHAGFIDQRSPRGPSERSLAGAWPDASAVPEEVVEATVVDFLAEQVEREEVLLLRGHPVDCRLVEALQLGEVLEDPPSGAVALGKGGLPR